MRSKPKAQRGESFNREGDRVENADKIAREREEHEQRKGNTTLDLSNDR